MISYSDENKNEVLISRNGQRFYYLKETTKREIIVSAIRFNYDPSCLILLYGDQIRLLDGKLFSNGENSYDVMVLGVQHED